MTTFYKIDETVLNKWREGNDKGNGFAIGGLEMTPRDAAEFEELDIIDEGITGSVLAWGTTEGYMLICDVNGPWAVSL